MAEGRQRGADHGGRSVADGDQVFPGSFGLGDGEGQQLAKRGPAVAEVVPGDGFRNDERNTEADQEEAKRRQHAEDVDRIEPGTQVERRVGRGQRIGLGEPGEDADEQGHDTDERIGGVGEERFPQGRAMLLHDALLECSPKWDTINFTPVLK